MPVRARLAADFKGSHYHMTHRSTIITRVHTTDGIAGEAYAGHEDATLLDIEQIVHGEIAPAVVGRSGGPTAWRRMPAVAMMDGAAVGHHEEPRVSNHLTASQPHGMYVECFHPDRDPFWWNLSANRPPLENGQLKQSDAPGLGWQLDTDYIERLRVRGE